MLFCYTDIINAKTVSHVACDYTIVNPLGEVMTYAQIQIKDYNDGAGGSVIVFFKDESEEYVLYEGPSYDWLNYGKIDSSSDVMLRFFTTDKNGKDFINNYKINSKCPVIYSNINNNGGSIDVENHVLEPTLVTGTSKEIHSSVERLKSGNGDWLTREKFYSDSSGGTTVKDDLVCNYDMEFDMYNIKAPVEFRTMYNASNGSKTYRVSINGNGYSYPSLNEDVFLMVGQGGADIVYISSTQLAKIFVDGSCYDRSKVYHYYDMSTSRYVITTDQAEASENGAAGRYDNGDGSNDGAGGNSSGGINISGPNMDISNENLTCAQLLGSNFLKILKSAFTLLRIAGSIIAIVNGMMSLIPAVTAGDQGALNKAIKKCIWMAVILVAIIMIPMLLRTIGNLFGFDISCLV